MLSGHAKGKSGARAGKRWSGSRPRGLMSQVVPGPGRNNDDGAVFPRLRGRRATMLSLGGALRGAVLGMLVLAFGATAHAQATVYVDAELNSDCPAAYDPDTRSCGAGSADAYNSLSFPAGARIAPGDTVLLRGGSYGQLVPPASGTPGRPITFKRQPGETAMIRDLEAEPALLIVRRSDLVIEGLKIENVTDFARLEDAQRITIRNTTFIGANSDNPEGAVTLVHSSFNRIHHNVFHQGLHNVLLEDGSDHNLLYGNLFAWGRDSLLGIRCSGYNVVRANTFSDPVAVALRVDDCDTPNATGPAVSAHNLIEGNLFTRTRDQGGAVPPACLQQGGQYTAVRGNVFTDCLGGAVVYRSGVSVSEVHGNRLYNNTFYNNRCYAIDAAGAAPTRFHDNIAKNNLLYANVDCNGGAGAQLRGADPGVVATADNSVARSDPGFSNVERLDFRLAPGSPYIDAGAFLTRAVGDGSGTELKVADAGYFYDGYGIEGESGDVVQLQGGDATARVIAADYATGILTLDQPLTWTDAQGVALAYTGGAPDAGAYETTAAHGAPPAAPELSLSNGARSASAAARR